MKENDRRCCNINRPENIKYRAYISTEGEEK